MPTALFSSEYQNYDEWYPALMRHMPELDVKRWPDASDPKDVDVLLVWSPPPEALQFPNLKLVQCLGAGVDHLVDLPIPAHVPLARLIDKSQVEGFVEYVVGAVLSHHRDFHRFRESQMLREWKKRPRMLAAERNVGIMGLGEMGSPCATRLASFGFAVRGWSRTPKSLPGVQCFSGDDEMDVFLKGLDIVVCVLPLTGKTGNILRNALFEKLAPGAFVINVGRGGHCNDRDLCDAISSGRLGGALLDVTSVEPLPADHSLWHQRGIEITPHIATSQSALSAAAAAVENIKRVRAGLEPFGLVDKSRRY
jgi:glyoxylate/hydroxypyruvate reductase